MNSYERIQQSIDYIEKHLTEEIALSEASRAACFSVAHFYRMFHALVGHSVKEYIRKRRLSEAADRLVGGNDRLIDICFDYRFEYQESFTRAFKAMFGETPGQFRKRRTTFEGYPPLNLIEKYYVPGTVNDLDPRIKVLKKLSPMRVASCRVISQSPEQDAYRAITQWARLNGLLSSSQHYRMFGFDNPGPTGADSTYGYEFWMTVGPDAADSDNVTIRNTDGGFYAVTGTTVGDISQAWKNFVTWLKISKYKPGDHPCLEEHLSPSETPDENTPIDLYLPLAEP